MRCAIANQFFEANRGALKRFCFRFGTDWTVTEAFLHVHTILGAFDLRQRRMTVVGYWLQRLGWKLPDADVREKALIMPPYKPTDAEREELRNLDIVHPDQKTESSDAWEMLLVEQEQL
jgi:hypothetical protein